ncbi:MAG TPA: nuclear transport factor 2 family protein [Myxococcota bacterium]|nr:nuclear transport factor 2 family protein [Myxococcota bacterium]
MEPFVALMRRYCIDYTNSHDPSVCDEIMAPEYVVHISGFDLPRDAAYKPAVTGVFARFPGLQLQVHEFVTNGERLAMRFSEHGAAADAGGRFAAWGGIGLYRWNGKQLLENFVEQDFLAQDEQLATGVPAPLESPHLDPWLGTRAEPASPAAEAVARAWLAKGDLRAAADLVIDGSWYAAQEPSPLEVESVQVNDLFSAGARVAFHVTQRGRYRGGLRGADAAWSGRAAALRCVGLARVEGGEVRAVRVITDRLGMRTALARDAG